MLIGIDKLTWPMRVPTRATPVIHRSSFLFSFPLRCGSAGPRKAEVRFRWVAHTRSQRCKKQDLVIVTEQRSGFGRSRALTVHDCHHGLGDADDEEVVCIGVESVDSQKQSTYTVAALITQ